VAIISAAQGSAYMVQHIVECGDLGGSSSRQTRLAEIQCTTTLHSCLMNRGVNLDNNI